jgi:uncharacterized DUF497 family protein
MDDALFEWDEANIGHMAQHDVDPEEAEEVVLGDPLDAGFAVIQGEDRWAYVGATNTGRILRVTLTVRGERIRVITAFEAEKHWKLFYLEERGGSQ